MEVLETKNQDQPKQTIVINQQPVPRSNGLGQRVLYWL